MGLVRKHCSALHFNTAVEGFGFQSVGPFHLPIHWDAAVAVRESNPPNTVATATPRQVNLQLPYISAKIVLLQHTLEST